MSSPFANGSAISAPMITRPTPAPQPQQPAEQYFGTQYRTLTHDEQRLAAEQKQIALLQRGRDLAGFVQRDRRAEGRGFEWQRTRGAQWPAEMPEAAAQRVEQAHVAERSARNALASAELEYATWERDHPTASDDRRYAKFEELTEDLAPVVKRAGEQLDRVLIEAAALVETIAQWRTVEQSAPARRAAAERQHQAALDAIDTDLMVARQAAQRAGVKV